MSGNAGDALDLMRRVARGERPAAATLFARYGDAVYRYIRGCGAGPDDAEDITQEVFVRALARAASYRGSGSLEGWLIRSARTQVVDRSREETARKRREQEWVATHASGDEVQGQHHGVLSRLLGEMEPDDREVIVLAKFLGFPATRIAEVLSIQPGAARVRLHRALRRLADRFEEVEAQ